MKRLLVVLLPVLLLVALASAGAIAQDNSTVQTHQDPKLGTFLTDAKGMTLYLFTKDKPNESVCFDKCAENWPPFTTSGGDLTLPSGVSGKLGTITRKDGAKQVTYNDIPLYYFAKDDDPGDTYGQGIGGVWFVVAPGAMPGTPVASPVASPSASPAGSPSANGSVAIGLSEFTVTASTTTFKVGQTYTFTATNEGQFTHEMVIEKAGVEDEPLETNGHEAEAEDIEPGQSGTLTWTFTEPGKYQIACHRGQHYENGMVIEIDVTG
ncbi:MAG TPA: plastocyanin/azurin family copper-binding protein [Thermomicrobiales bacterium]|nr:plastocyanin/azurin family copper-binding protein [Thermomicrobiales bacterium]